MTAPTPIVSFTLNGTAVAVAAAPLAPLAETLRGPLGLTGTKIGCAAGDCGACTLLLDGRQACACLVSTAQAQGRRIDTVEAASPVLARLRRAFLAHGAAQCGICTPAMLMAGADLLTHTRAPSAAEIADAIAGVLCRCTGYVTIIAAIAAASKASECAATPPAQPGAASAAVGARLPRVDGWQKVAGTDIFAADAAPEEALWMRIVRSPHACADFRLGDLAAVTRRTPGLAAILSAKDVPGENAFGVFPDLRDQPILAPGGVRFRGEAILALVGTRAALDSLSDADLPISWSVRAPLVDVDAALTPGARPLHASHPDNVLVRGRLSSGDVARGHAEAAATVEGRFETAFVEHAYIEPEAGFAVPIGGGPLRIEVSACTQAPYMAREETARAAGLPPSRVRIRPTACGGGFGGKLDVSVQPLLAIAAFHTRRPVRIVYTRTESMASTTKRHPARIWAKASALADGRLAAFEMRADFNTGAYASWGPTVANRVPVHAHGPYRVPNVCTRTRAVYTNAAPSGAFRGFGVPQAAIAGETLMDDLAERLGIDRWHIRRINALTRGDTTASGQLLKASAGLPQCLDALAGAWQAALQRAGEVNAARPRRRRGVGIAAMWYGCGNTALPNPSTMRITLGRDGRLTLFNGAVDIGQGSTTVLLQIAADALGLPVGQFGCVLGDTDLTGDAGKTSASRQTFVSGNAARLAGEDLRRKVLAYANAGDGASLTLAKGLLTIADGETVRTLDVTRLPHRHGVVLEGVGTWDPPSSPLDDNGQGNAYATYGFAAQVAEVEVDMALATTRVVRIVAAHDVGRAINPTLVEGQIHGGIAQGLGLALMEEFVPGRTENLHDYLIPTAGDVPDITIHLIEDPEPEGPFGAKGVGEPALIATAPAILSAIRHATGIRITRVPVLPHRLWAALREQGAPEAA
jgi:aldehyde oxidoreductase